MAIRHWRPVPGFPDLLVTAEGKVRCFARTTPIKGHRLGAKNRFVPERECLPYLLDGYLCVYYSTKRTTLGVHNLVCRAFHGEPPADKPYALHKDGVKTHNNPDNLYWGDAFDNAQDAILHGDLVRGESHGRSVLTDQIVLAIRDTCIPGDPDLGYKPLARQYGVDPATIKSVFHGKTWQHVKGN